MKIHCPSCGKPHLTEDHGGAFEIPCSCGYQILMPDVAALQEEQKPRPKFENAKPLAGTTDSEFDLGKKILDRFDPRATRIEHGVTPAAEQRSEQSAVGNSQAEFTAPPLFEFGGHPVPEALGPQSNPRERTRAEKNPYQDDQLEDVIPASRKQMSAPQDLPPSLPYDPFEIEQRLPQHRESNETGQSQSSGQFQGQQILSRVQQASFDQYMGPQYRLTIEGLGDRELQELRLRVIRVLSHYPWLEVHLRNHGFPFDNATLWRDLTQVPEILAVEIYMLCTQLGGYCRFEINN